MTKRIETKAGHMEYQYHKDAKCVWITAFDKFKHVYNFVSLSEDELNELLKYIEEEKK